jgi:hypothetical protein
MTSHTSLTRSPEPPSLLGVLAEAGRRWRSRRACFRVLEVVVQVEQASGLCPLSPIRLARTWSSVSCWPGCVRWLRRRTLRSACCALSWRLSGSCGSGWSCRSPGCSGGWAWTAPTRDADVQGTDRGEGTPQGRAQEPAGLGAGAAQGPQAGRAARPSGQPHAARPGPGRPQDRRPASAVLAVQGRPGGREPGRAVVGAGLGRDDQPAGHRVAAARADLPVLRGGHGHRRAGRGAIRAACRTGRR